MSEVADTVVKFNDLSINWSSDPEFNFLFLRTQKNHFNDCLRSRGHVFLNEVYDGLGLPRTSNGAIMGWLFSSRESHISFGEMTADENGSIQLDFNVDGVIYDKIEDHHYE